MELSKSPISSIAKYPFRDPINGVICVISGVYIENIQLDDYYNLVYAVYAHQYYNRLLVTDIRIERTGNLLEDIIIGRTSLTGNIASDDINFVEPESYVGASACAVSIQC